MNIFAQNAAAMHRANLAVLGGASDPLGRQLYLWYPRTAETRPRALMEDGSTFHEPPIPAIMGPARRDAVAAVALAMKPTTAVAISAEARHFPASNPPRDGICFLAGASREEALFYRITRATSVAGLVEMEAVVER